MIRATRYRRRRSNRGAEVVEFALVVPLLIMLLFGMVGFGHAFMTYHAMAAAAREGVRLAAVTRDVVPNDVRVDQRVRQVLTNNFVNAANANITTTRPGKCGGDVRVLITLPYTSIIGANMAQYVGMSQNMQLQQSAVMLWEC